MVWQYLLAGACYSNRPGCLVLYLALYFGIFGLFFSTQNARRSTPNLFFIPAIWVILEYVRSYLFTGFPWSLLGYTQYHYLPIIQIADVTGAWGVSFLVMMGNVFAYNGKKFVFKQALIFFTVLTIVLFYGFYNLRTPHSVHGKAMKISVIQGNIPQELKWAQGQESKILDRYLNLSLQAAKEHPNLIIWPEAALPVVLESEPSFIAAVEKFAQEAEFPVLLGAVTLRDELYYNSAVLISGAGSLVSRYDKLHLVPFGEYIPLKQVFGFLQTVVPIGEIERGKNYTIFKEKADFGVLICFEDLFPELSRGFIKRGANFLVNITNDAWYKETSAAYQHFQANVFRAVENKVYLVRSANTGISGFIAPTGKIISLVKNAQGKNIFVPGYATQDISPSSGKITFYSRYGDIFIILSLILCLISFF
ncbi:MAG: apolipoprotein N-acyltransferase [Candidatus Omnitrophica bacterium]|nr:apolipoprotein N-acyltransferase [Candidatus Omnitrophota bacterium]